MSNYNQNYTSFQNEKLQAELLKLFIDTKNVILKGEQILALV